MLRVSAHYIAGSHTCKDGTAAGEPRSPRHMPVRVGVGAETQKKKLKMLKLKAINLTVLARQPPADHLSAQGCTGRKKGVSPRTAMIS